MRRTGSITSRTRPRLPTRSTTRSSVNCSSWRTRIPACARPIPRPSASARRRRKSSSPTSTPSRCSASPTRRPKTNCARSTSAPESSPERCRRTCASPRSTGWRSRSTTTAACWRAAERAATAAPAKTSRLTCGPSEPSPYACAMLRSLPKYAARSICARATSKRSTPAASARACPSLPIRATPRRAACASSTRN